VEIKKKLFTDIFLSTNIQLTNDFV